MNASSENGQLARQMLDEYMQSFQQRNPTLRVFSAHLHMDEATPHLHIDFIPFQPAASADSKPACRSKGIGSAWLYGRHEKPH